MLFITNRTPKGSAAFEKNRPIEFDIKDNTVSNSIFFCERLSQDQYVEIGSKEFMRRLKECRHKQILIYIHGFSNLPEPNVFPKTEKLQKLFDEREKNMVIVVPIIWPCDSDFGIIKDYWDDQKAADQTGIAIARALGKFMDWRNSNPDEAQCMKRINILAHSMGNRVLRESLRAWCRYDLADGVPMIFRNIFMAAADIVNESLEVGGWGEQICYSARNVCVYFASDDLALRASKASNLKNKVASRRLGHTGPEDLSKCPKNVYEIDCDDINTRYDTPSGHSYYMEDESGKPGVVFEHMYRTIKTGRASLMTSELRSVILDRSGTIFDTEPV